MWTSFVAAALFVVGAQSASSSSIPCSPVSAPGSQIRALTYNNIGRSGTYNRVTYTNSDASQCVTTPYEYSGALAPFNEELSVHIRGPIQLKSFAAYTQASSQRKLKRSTEPAPPLRQDRQKRHAHGHGHRRGHGHARLHTQQVEERAVGDIVYDTTNGVLVSWTNVWSGTSVAETSTPWSATEAPATQITAPTGIPPQLPGSGQVFSTAAVPSQPPPASDGGGEHGVSSTDGSVSGDGWTRTGYYVASSGKSDGLVFLNNQGTDGVSGVFDNYLGASLSYATSDGSGCSATAQTLADTMLSSGTEIAIMTDKPCGANNGSCGYYRPGSVAYHGFDGSEKVFLFEFMMPEDVGNLNTPAIWFLNANIPRIAQYASNGCTCWNNPAPSPGQGSGCGELDVFEVIPSSCSGAVSQIYANVTGTSGDTGAYYFSRPESSYIQMAVIMSDDSVNIVTLGDSMDFSQSLSTAQVAAIIRQGTSGNDQAVVLNAA